MIRLCCRLHVFLTGTRTVRLTRKTPGFTALLRHSLGHKPSMWHAGKTTHSTLVCDITTTGRDSGAGPEMTDCFIWLLQSHKMCLHPSTLLNRFGFDSVGHCRLLLRQLKTDATVCLCPSVHAASHDSRRHLDRVW